MGVPLSVKQADIYMIRTDRWWRSWTTVTSFQKRYVDDIYGRLKKNCSGQLYHELNNYHPNINITAGINPKKFIDLQVMTKNPGKIETAIYRKSIKLTVL